MQPHRKTLLLTIAGLLLVGGRSLRAADQLLTVGRPADVGISARRLDEAVEVVRKSVQQAKIHGAVLLVVRNGRVVLHQALGWRNAEDRIAMREDTLFKMASNTKPVIATAILQLVDRGLLGLDDPVGQHIPSWQQGSVSNVTIRQLLSHTSGLRISGVFVRPLLTKAEHPNAPSLEAEVDRFAGIGIKAKPGMTYSYNNAGFQVLGRLIEVASQKSLKAHLRESIYRPLKMNDSWNHETDVPRERMSLVYAWKDDRRVVRWRPADGPDWPIVRASGGMICTAGNYAIFCQMYLNGGVYGGQTILTASSVQEATGRQTTSAFPPAERDNRDSFYGLGWSVNRRSVFSHFGSDGTMAWVDPRRQLIVLVFTQSPGGDNPGRQFFNNVLTACDVPADPDHQSRPRLRDLGIAIGTLPTGPTNSLTDVRGVLVGHHTVVEEPGIRTGVTAILPHGGNVFRQKVPAAVHVANGFGKFVGTTQVEELGVLETPILLTNTLSTFAAADALVGWTLGQAENADVRSVNPVVGECNDGYLNDIRQRRLSVDDFYSALQSAHAGPVSEGCLGAGTGVRCMFWKSGIGSSSRRLPAKLGGYTVGVLVQTNFAGSLSVAGVPVGREMGRYYLKDALTQHEHGSCIVIVATDAPLDARRLKRLARRAPLGLAAAGSPITHGSGDYVLAFSTHPGVRTRYQADEPLETARQLRDDQMSPLFQAVRDATEEAVINSLLKATSMTGHNGHRVEAIDPQELAAICRKHVAIVASDDDDDQE
jgi:D-aminopeptidase